VDATKLRTFLDLDFPMVELRRRHGLLAEVLEHADLKPFKGAWIRRLEMAVDDMFSAFDDGESEVLRVRTAREIAKGEARAKKPKDRRPKPVGPVNEDLSHDPKTIPGAIRMVLARHPDGLRARELMAEVKKVRPETEDPSVSAALHPMVRRHEIARDGFHKSYKYSLVVKTPPPVTESETALHATNEGDPV
jgi:hypothetical protein